jgi:hypothetical protein
MPGFQHCHPLDLRVPAVNNRVVRESDFLNNPHTRKPRIAKQIEEVFVVIRIKA